MRCYKKHVRIPLSGVKGRGKCALVDPEDAARVRKYTWWLSTNASRTVYAFTTVCKNGRRKTLHMHRLINAASKETDHEDGDGLNNCRRNIRSATRRQNQQNKRAPITNTSGFKGVFAWRGRWRAVIRTVRRQRNLGSYSTTQAAARAYDTAARKYHKKFARLNFPRRGEQRA